MGNVLAELHLLLMVVSFVWHSVTAYAATSEGAQELSDIEAVFNGLDNVPTEVKTAASVIDTSLEAARARTKAAQ